MSVTYIVSLVESTLANWDDVTFMTVRVTNVNLDAEAATFKILFAENDIVSVVTLSTNESAIQKTFTLDLMQRTLRAILDAFTDKHEQFCEPLTQSDVSFSI